MLAIHWFLPTGGDSRDVLPDEGEHLRQPDHHYLAQLATASWPPVVQIVVAGTAVSAAVLWLVRLLRRRVDRKPWDVLKFDRTALPLVVYPNSGEHYDAVTKTWHHHGEACETLAGYLPQWLAAGAKLIGGCCRTTPKDIAELKAQR